MIQFTVNGKPASTDAPAATPLLWVIREGLKLTQDLLHATPTRHLDLTPGVSENDLHRLASPVTPSETRARA